MKLLQLLAALFLVTGSTECLQAQNPLSQESQFEVGISYIRPYFISGKELVRAADLRQSGLSYYANDNGLRKNVGAYSVSSGQSIFVGFYKPVKVVKGLMLGALVRNAQTGSSPSNGGYEEAYFFNFITAGMVAKYYPFENNNMYVKTDVGLASVLTKNRFINSSNEQNFFHQFGIGIAGGFETGYSLELSKSKKYLVELKAGYQIANTRVEVNTIGDDNWRFGALYFGSSFNF